ncbi:hypothetical protein U1Q18_050217, partial [Sarracenia purpurea var. burkii]
KKEKIAEYKLEEAKGKLEKIKMVMNELPEEKEKLTFKNGAIYLEDWVLAGDGVFGELPGEVFHVGGVRYISRYGTQQVRSQLAETVDVRKVALGVGWWAMTNDSISPAITGLEIEQIINNLQKKKIEVQIWTIPEANSRIVELRRR